MMTDEVVSFEVAKLAYEAGFYRSAREHGEVHGGWYNELGKYLGRLDIDKDGVDLMRKHPTLTHERRKMLYLKSYYAPTQSLLQRWLREEKGIHVTLECQFETVKPYYEWYIYCHESKKGSIAQVKGVFFTYEDCLSDGLLHALKLLLST